MSGLNTQMEYIIPLSEGLLQCKPGVYLRQACITFWSIYTRPVNEQASIWGPACNRANTVWPRKGWPVIKNRRWKSQFVVQGFARSSPWVGDYPERSLATNKWARNMLKFFKCLESAYYSSLGGDHQIFGGGGLGRSWDANCFISQVGCARIYIFFHIFCKGIYTRSLGAAVTWKPNTDHPSNKQTTCFNNSQLN